MATITPTSLSGSGDRAVTVTVLTASDDFVYNSAKRPVLVLNNVTGGALSPLIVGADATTQPCAGIGDVDVSGGFQAGSIAAGDTVAIPLDSISAYLKGAITMTGADAIEAQLLEY